MARNPTVDVILPVYNAERYIVEAIKSIENQTYPVNKLIIVNDGSTDASKERILEYKKLSKLDILYIETENKGPSHARNEGLKLCTADYISFHDADDVALPHKLKSQMDFFDRNPSILLVHAHFLYTDANLNHIESQTHNRQNVIPIQGNVTKSVFYDTESISLPTVVVSRKVFELIGNFDENLRYAEDHDFLIRVSTVSDFGYIPEVCLFMRRHADNTTNSKTMSKEMFNFYNKWLSNYPDDARLVRDLRKNIPYQAFKYREMYSFIKTNLNRKAAHKIFPFGMIDMAILFHLPEWMWLSLMRRIKSRKP